MFAGQRKLLLVPLAEVPEHMVCKFRWQTVYCRKLSIHLLHQLAVLLCWLSSLLLLQKLQVAELCCCSPLAASLDHFKQRK